MYARAVPPPLAPAVAPGLVQPCIDGAKHGSDDFGRERQLREFRRANGLCFKCGDKYTREHKCNKVGHLLTIEVGDHGELLSDDAIRALELLDENSEEDAACCQISVHAVAGPESSGTMRLRALVGNQVMLLLVDSGSTHTFVNSAFAEHVGCTIQNVDPVTVRVANGETLQSKQQVSQLQWWCQGHTFSTDMRLLELGAYDAVLGVDWLAQFSPMNRHWGLKTMEFRHAHMNIKLQGVRTPTEPTLTEIRADQLTKWIQGNEVWALAVLHPEHKPALSDDHTPHSCKLSWMNMLTFFRNQPHYHHTVSLIMLFISSPAPLHPMSGRTVTRHSRRTKLSVRLPRC